jgi:transposase
MTVLTARPEVSRLEVVDTGRRRRWTEEEKLRIVSESLSGPRLVSSTARRYGIARSLLVIWRRQFGVRAVGSGSGLVPAVVVAERVPASSRMEIVAANCRRIIVDAGVDAAALRLVLDVLERR